MDSEQQESSEERRGEERIQRARRTGMLELASR
jgi:hypothetical protein